MTDEEDTRSDEIADEDKRPATKQMAKRLKVSRKFVKKGDTSQSKDGGINTYCNVLETVRRIKGVLRKEELEVFRGTVFGKLLDVPEVRWISNGLLVGLLERYKLPKQGITGCKEMKFKIKGRKVLFTKPEFELIAGLGSGGIRITLNDERLGDFGLRYFNTGKSIQRCHITDALLQHNKDDLGVETDDVVKLALLHLLGNVMFGHQSCVSFPIGYINLVDDLDAFDKFPWGEVIWEELLTHVGRCAQSLKARERGRVMFGGFVFALQESQGKVLKMILEQLERQKGDDTEERGFKKIDDEIVNENVESEDMENKNMGNDTILEEDGTDHGDVGKDGTSRHDDNDLGHVDTTVINEGDDKIKQEVNAILKGTIEGNIFEKEVGSDMEPAANANFEKVQMDSTIDEQGITLPEEGMDIKGKCMDVDAATKELVEHVKMDTIIDAQPISEYNGNVENEAPCVLTRKITLSQMEVVIGPFSLNPKEMPPQEDIDKLKTFIECGMLKRKARTGVRKIYTKGDENMTKKPIVLDKFIISSKTWLYDLFMDQEWLDTLHMEVGMFYLEVKRFNYKLTQTYSTVTPFFLECLKQHQDDIDKKIKTKEDVGSVSNLTAEVFGFARNGSCGMFVLKIAEYLIMDMDIRDIRTDQMAAYRMKMATELVQFAESNMAAKE
ncbi:unnamed protein product [Cuscuta campestris]|uniref:DUF1985 domain-containing protein n=1 Tax=Cuscuta campestris TaxID=132261 RepID=A0A484LS87_9ASTE|nr:unnamed protein product [Cuscuta campestris]